MSTEVDAIPYLLTTENVTPTISIKWSCEGLTYYGSENLGSSPTTLTDAIPYLKGNEQIIKASDNKKYDATGSNLNIKESF